MAGGDLRITLASGAVLELPAADLVLENAAPLIDQQQQSGGAIDYRTYNPEQASYWDPFRDTSGGCGGFYADVEDGRYGISGNFDAEYMVPGPRQCFEYTASDPSFLNDYPGIPNSCRVIQWLSVGSTLFALTDDPIYSLFRLKQGEVLWLLVGGGWSGTVATNFTGWSAVTTTGVPKCMVAMNDKIAVGFGSGTAFVYSANSLDHATTLSWTASTNASNGKYMDWAIDDQYTPAGVSTSARRVIFGVQTTAGGETFFCTTLANGGTLTVGPVIGDTTDDLNSIVMAEDQVLIVGKRKVLWKVTPAGAISRENRKDHDYATVTESGITNRAGTASGLVPNNFRQPVTTGDGYSYWIVGDYTLLERNPDTGLYRVFSLKEYGPMTPIMHLPITAICEGPDSELIVAVGTTAKSSYFDLGNFPGYSRLSANAIVDGTTYLFKGKWRTLSPQAAQYAAVDPNTGKAWVWHGYIASIDGMVTSMHWNKERARLFLGNGENDFQGNASPAKGYIRSVTGQTGGDDTLGSYTSRDSLQNATPTTWAMNAWDTGANGNYIYWGHAKPFRQLWVQMNPPNQTANTMTLEFWNGSAWTAVSSLLDGTDSGPSFGAGGLVAWAFSSTWTAKTVNGQSAYWVRMSWNAQFGNASGVTLTEAQFAHLGAPCFVMAGGNPMIRISGTADTTVKQWIGLSGLESGLFSARRPNIAKAARKLEVRGIGIGTDGTGSYTGPSLLTRYRVAEDSADTDYVTLALQTTVATAQAGTVYPESIIFYGMRLQVLFSGDATTVAPVQLLSVTQAYVDSSPVKRRLMAVLDVADGVLLTSGVKARVSLREVYDFCREWTTAGLDPVAKVEDVHMGLSFDPALGTGMRLAYGYPRLRGKGKTRQLEIAMTETV